MCRVVVSSYQVGLLVSLIAHARSETSICSEVIAWLWSYCWLSTCFSFASSHRRGRVTFHERVACIAARSHSGLRNKDWQ